MNNILNIEFKGFSVNNYGKDTITLTDENNKKITLKGKWLFGSLIRLYDETGRPKYYIHDGGPQKNSGSRYIPVTTEVIPESISLVNEDIVNKLSLKLDENVSLVAEKNIDNGYKEIFLGIESKEGVWLQDLAIIGQNYHYDKTGEVVQNPNQYSVKVFGNENEEDFTEEFLIGTYEG